MQTKTAVLYLFEKNSVASQRYRLENVVNFLGENNFKIIYLKKGIINLFINELKIIKCFKYDKILFNRWPTHVGFSFSLIFLSFFSKIIFDFDDAIWTSEKKKLINIYKNLVFKIHCFISYKIICGNIFLKNKTNSNKSLVIPTSLDNKFFNNKINLNNNKIIHFGWSGSNSTINYLEDVLPSFDRLYKENKNFKLLYMSDKPSELLELKEYSSFKKWSITTEINFIDCIDCGIMPLKNSEWENGKCGFKLIQYLSRGKFSLASYSQVNKFLLSSGRGKVVYDEWFNSLMESFEHFPSKINNSSINFIKNNYSIQSHKELLSKLLT